MLGVSYVMDVMKFRKRVFGEAHRLKGLTRFIEIGNNLYYASLHPDHKILEELGHFFMKRFPNQSFILHDQIHEIVFIYNQKEYQMVPISNLNFVPPTPTPQEKEYQRLWKCFFDTIAIKERTNPRLQMQYMPKKYWIDLIEKRSSL